MDQAPSRGSRRRAGRPGRKDRASGGRHLTQRGGHTDPGPRLGLFLACLFLVLVVLVSTPATSSFSVYEDPRADGVSWFPPQASEGGEPGAAGSGTGGGQDPGSVGESGTSAQPPDEQSGAQGGPVTYVVKSGDTLSEIAARFQVTVTDIWIANRLASPHVLRIGQSLLIPSGEGDLAYGMTPAPDQNQAAAPTTPVYYRVKTGESLWVIASRHGTTVDAICDLNGISAREVLKAGQRLELPSGTVGVDEDGAFRIALPVRGEITSGFGMRHGTMHQAIDIAAPRGTPILVVASGRVVSAGWMGNYGRTVVVDHGGGYSTLYAHCDQLLVTKGEQVQAGQSIALLGSTGRSTGPHVHFELIVNGQRRNPLEYLY